MGLYRIRHCSVYVNSKKIATATGGSLEITGNDEDQIVDEGWGGASDGAITSKLNLDTIVPVTGELKALRNAFLNKQYVKVQITPFDGDILSIDMKCMDHKANWDNAKGTVKGNFTFSGGKPENT